MSVKENAREGSVKMRVEIEIPEAFEKEFNQDRFKESLERIMADIKHSLENGDCLCAGNYEYETIEMLEKALEAGVKGMEGRRMSYLYIEARLQAIKDIASASCVDIKDADNIANFCDEIYSAIHNLDNVVKELEKERDENE